MEPEEALKIDPLKTDRIIAEAIDDREADDNLIRLSTGVVLKAKQANPSLLIRVMTKMPRPTPPIYLNKAMGREMENPDDPDYIARVKAYEMDYANGMMNVLIGVGTELVSLPVNALGPKDEQWIKDYQALGLPVILESDAWRYITWVMAVAAPTDKDLALIQKKVLKLSGVKEADVRDGENFPKSN